jgi:ATP-dependent exoDNAse (exonuclease V) beta subunit
MQNHLPQPLDPVHFPLSGRSLIEASAGTGKTFTIAMLYVRLVLGHDGGDAQTRPLMPPEILVVTFTDAATKELRDRIRRRLTQAAHYFQQDPDEVTPPAADDEDLLHELRAQYEPAQWTLCADRLRSAAEWMDESAVSTIHSWCNRMLREHAFDSDSLFNQTLETDQSGGSLLPTFRQTARARRRRIGASKHSPRCATNSRRLIRAAGTFSRMRHTGLPNASPPNRRAAHRWASTTCWCASIPRCPDRTANALRR